MKILPLSRAISAILSLSCCVFYADAYADDTANLSKDGIEVITIEAPKFSQSQTAMAEGNLVKPDVADWLKTVPGANINKNGPITGIAQYRGLYGDRIAKNIGGIEIVGAGPNAMDAPLTYTSAIMVDSVSVFRGIAPVRAGIDTFGGAVKVNLKKAQVALDKAISGDFALSYNDNNDATTIAGDVNISDQSNGILLYWSKQQADDYQDGDDQVIKSTEYHKRQNGLDLRHYGDNWHIGATWHQTNTQQSGTPALPMDIDYIEADRFSVDGEFMLSQWLVNWQLGYQQGDHGMDNFSQRTNMNSAMYRYNTTDVKTTNYRISFRQNHWLLGVEGVNAKHNAVITNPNNMMFRVNNFNDVKDERNSAFVEWSTRYQQFSHTLGLRIKNNRANADDVNHFMAMMNPMIGGLQNDFNQQDKRINDTTFDIAINSDYQLNEQMNLHYAFAIKQRAASYQERYLWLPMQATAGLADGKTYVGNIHLDHETAYQFNAGINYQHDKFSVAPQIFYQKINDYIQGTPATDMRVKMVAGMMGDNSPLQFSNIDASLMGADMNWQYSVNDQFSLSGVVSYVKGKRHDIDDDLYRISPLNSRINVNYQFGNWQSNLAIHAFSRQNKVSALNKETASSGYAVVNWQLDYFIDQQMVIRTGINNLFDKHYRDHLAGINRARGSDIAVGEKISAMGRNIYIALDYQF